MNIQLHRLSLRNFKNCSERDINFQGLNASIYGTNAAGKTTIYDAFTWLLFDKNSLGATQFDIKPIGMERPEVSVSAVLEVDGKEVELKKVLTEKWTRRRGDDTEQFTGNETAYFVNGIEKKKNEYVSFIDSIIKEKDFRMLTSAEYFLSLKKPEMRAELIKMAGGIDDMSVAGSDLDLINLVKLMQDKGYSLDDMLKLTKQNVALYNTENQSIGTRIDEVRRSMPEEQDYSKLEEAVTIAKGYIKEIDQRLSSTRTAVLEVQKKQNEVSALRMKIDKYARIRTEEANADYFKSQITLQQAQTAIQKAKAKCSTVSIDAFKQQIEQYKSRILELQNDYKEQAKERKEVAETPAEPLDENAVMCDKCGQKLPEGQIEQLKEQALIAYHDKQSAILKKHDEKLERIVNQGKSVSEQKQNMEKRLADAERAYEAAQKEVELAEAYVKELEEAQTGKGITEKVDLTGDPAYEQMQDELAKLESSIVVPEDKTEGLLASKARLEQQVEEINKRMKGKEDREKGFARIEELTERGKQLSGLISGEKAKQYQIERFIRLRSEFLEDSINALFDGDITFRLFDVQINGGIVDDCTPLIKNVEYASASNSERIRACQSIVKAFQISKGVTVVSFLDNAEALTEFIQMPGQEIRLIVSADDPFLRIEFE